MHERVADAAEEVHNHLGEGFTESVYHKSMVRELSDRGIPCHTEGTISVMYKGAPVGRRRPDLFVVTDDGLLVVELKAGSSSGSEQLEQYIDMTTSNNNLGTIVGGMVIRFNEEVETEYTEVSK